MWRHYWRTSQFIDFIPLFLLLLLASSANYVICAEEGQSSSKGVSQLKLFQSLFQQRRSQHKEAVGTISKLDYARQAKMIKIIAENAFQVLERSQVKLQEVGYIPGMEFPEDEIIREALSKTLENTVFMGEVILHFPDMTKAILREKKSWELLLTWGVFFASQSNFLDKNTNRMIYLLTQELGLAERDPDYINPYAKAAKGGSTNEKNEGNQEPLKKKKKTFKKGPRLSRQFGDL